MRGLRLFIRPIEPSDREAIQGFLESTSRPVDQSTSAPAHQSTSRPVDQSTSAPALPVTNRQFDATANRVSGATGASRPLVDSSTGRLVDPLVDSSTGRLVDPLVDSSTGRLVDSLVGSSTGRLVDPLVDSSTGRLVDSLVGSSTGRRVDPLVDSSTGRLVDWRMSGLVAKLLGDIVAVVFVEEERDVLRVRLLLVAESFRKKRIGRAMLAELEQFARKLNNHSIVVESGDATGAEEFLRRTGFHGEGERWVRVVP